MKNIETMREILNKYVIAFVKSKEYPELTNAFNNNLILIKPNIEYAIYDNFLKCKKTVLELYMNDKSDGIDRHKEGACLIYAIIEANPFTFDKCINDFYKDRQKSYEEHNTDEIVPYEVSLCTYICAINAAISYVFSQKIKLYNIKNKEIELWFPDTYEQGNYIINFAIDLYYSKEQNHFDILAIANILFLIERYMDCLYFKKNGAIELDTKQS